LDCQVSGKANAETSLPLSNATRSHFLFSATLILILEVARARRSTTHFIPTTENISRILIATSLLDQIAETKSVWKSKCVLLSRFCSLIGISEDMVH
jgi:hypothetical protein